MVKIALFSVSQCNVANLWPERTKQSLSSGTAMAKTGTNSKSVLYFFIP